MEIEELGAQINDWLAYVYDCIECLSEIMKEELTSINEKKRKFWNIKLCFCIEWELSKRRGNILNHNGKSDDRDWKTQLKGWESEIIIYGWTGEEMNTEMDENKC